MKAQLPSPSPSQSPSSPSATPFSHSPSLPTDWALWQLLDSALPTGGFAHSLGVESATRSGLVSDAPSLSRFISCMLEGHAALQLPFVFAAHTAVTMGQWGAEGAEAGTPGGPAAAVAAAGGGGGEAVAAAGAVKASSAGLVDVAQSSSISGPPHGQNYVNPSTAAIRSESNRAGSADSADNTLQVVESRGGTEGLEAQFLLHLLQPMVDSHVAGGRFDEALAVADSTLNCMMLCDVARRVSLSQGSALLRVASSLFPECRLLGDYRRRIRRQASEDEGDRVENADVSRALGHLAIVFGVVTAAARIGASAAQRAFVFCALRDSLSAATRLGLIGPMEAARMLRQLSGAAESAVLRWHNRTIDEARQVSPVVEILQGCHVALSSRLFLS